MTDPRRHTNENPGSTIDAEIADLLDRYLSDRQQGIAVDRARWLGEHPEHAERLAECLDAAELFGAAESGGFDLPADPVLPESIGDFQILRELGRGGMGVVYEAREKSLDRIVALKVMRFGIVDPKALDRFRREAETAGALHHTNIVPVYATGREGDTSWYAMQRIEGESLAERLSRCRRDDRLPEIDQILDVGIQAADALSHAHQRNVVHRDVKPANLILDRQQRVWLTDFGLARRLVDAGATMTGAILGTPRYMSPEQADLRSTDIDHRSDIYSLAATLYEMTTGRPPFEGDDPLKLITTIRYEDPPTVRSLRADVPRDLEVVLHKAMDKDPGRRYQSAADFADDLRAIHDDHPIQARPLSILERAARFTRKHQSRMRIVAIAIAATTLLIFSLLYGLDQWNQSRRGAFRIRAGGVPAQATIFPAGGSPLSVDAFDLTIPMQNQYEVVAGDYDAIIAPRGHWSRTLRLPVTKGMPSEYRLTSDGAPIREMSIDGALVVTVADDQHPAALWRHEGLLKKMSWNEDEDWQIDVSAVETPVTTIDADEPSEDPRATVSVDFANTRLSSNYDRGQHFLDDAPVTTQGAAALRTRIDLDGDGRSDTLVAAIDRQALLAIDHYGNTLWSRAYQFAGQPSQTHLPDPRSAKGTLPFPGVFDLQTVGDLDGDGIDDLFVTLVHFRIGVQTDVCLVTISGKSGDPINSYSLVRPAPRLSSWPADGIFHPDRNNYRPYDSWSLSASLFRRTSHRSMNDFQLRERPRSSPLLIGGPSPPVLVQDGDRMMVVLLVGDRAEFIDWPDRDSIATVALPFVPPHAPKIARTRGGTRLIFHANDESSATGTWTNGTEVHAYDLHGNLAWSKQIDNVTWQHAIGRNHADWPCIADVDGDGNDEVVLPRCRYRNGLDLGVDLLDAETGNLLWPDLNSYPAMRSADNCLARIVLSDDIDGDRWNEIATASFAGAGVSQTDGGEGSSQLYVYVDWVSGKTGRRLAWARHPVPIVGDQIRVGQIDAIRSRFTDAPSGTVEIDLVTGDRTLDAMTETAVIRFHPNRPGPVAIAAGLDVCPTPAEPSSSIRAYRRRGGPYGIGDDHLILMQDYHSSRERLGESNLLASWKAASGKTLIATSGFQPPRISVIDVETDQTVWSSDRTDAEGLNWIPVKRTDGTIDFFAQRNRGEEVPPSLIDGDTGQELFRISEIVGGRVIWNRFLDDGKSMFVVGDGRLSSHQNKTLLGRPSNSFHLSLMSATTGEVRWSTPFLLGAARINSPQDFDHLDLRDVNSDGIVDVIGSHSHDDDLFLAAWDGSSGEKLWERSVHQKPPRTDYWIPFTAIQINGQTYIAYLGHESEESQQRKLLLCGPDGELVAAQELDKAEQLALVDRSYSYRYLSIDDVTTAADQPMIAIGRSISGHYHCDILGVSSKGFSSIKTFSEPDASGFISGMWFRDVDGDGTKERLVVNRVTNDLAGATQHRDALAVKCFPLLSESPGYEFRVPGAGDLQDVYWKHDHGVPISWLRVDRDRIVAIDWSAGTTLAETTVFQERPDNVPVLCSDREPSPMLASPTLDGIEFRRLGDRSTATDSAITLHDEFDPRRTRKLVESIGGDTSLGEMATDMLKGGIAIGILFVLPMWYVRQSIRDRRWSLAWMLLLPVIVGLWIVAWQSRWLREPDLTVTLMSGVATWMCGGVLFLAAGKSTDVNGHSIRLMVVVGTPLVFFAFLSFAYLQRSDPSLRYRLDLPDLVRVGLLSFGIVAEIYWVLRILATIVRRLGFARRHETAS